MGLAAAYIVARSVNSNTGLWLAVRFIAGCDLPVFAPCRAAATFAMRCLLDQGWASDLVSWTSPYTGLPRFPGQLRPADPTWSHTA